MVIKILIQVNQVYLFPVLDRNGTIKGTEFFETEVDV